MVQTVGVDILVVFLMLVGVVLLTGASLAAVLRATGNGLSIPAECCVPVLAPLSRHPEGSWTSAGDTGKGGPRRKTTGCSRRSPPPTT